MELCDLISTIGNNCCGFESYRSEFSTDLEGVKLDTVVMESKLSTEIHSNTQAIIGIHSELEKIQNDHRICIKQSNYHPQNTAKSLDGNQTCTVNRLVKDNHQLVENINNLTTELETCKNRLNNIESGINYDSTQHCALLTTITVSTLHGTLCLVRALIWPFGSSINCMCLCCYVVEVLFVSCCICSCECLSYRV